MHWNAMQCNAMQFNAMQCNGMLCYVVLCYVCMYVCVCVWLYIYIHIHIHIHIHTYIYIIIYILINYIIYVFSTDFLGKTGLLVFCVSADLRLDFDPDATSSTDGASSARHCPQRHQPRQRPKDGAHRDRPRLGEPHPHRAQKATAATCARMCWWMILKDWSIFSAISRCPTVLFVWRAKNIQKWYFCPINPHF